MQIILDIKHCNTITYVKISVVNRILYFLVFSFLVSSCSTQKTVVTNLPNYNVEQQGGAQRPTVLLFQDPGCGLNDSISKFLNKTGYNVLRITKQTESLDVQNSDHKERRGYEGVELYNELAQKYNIKALASTGLEIHSSIPWFVNTPVQTLYFYNYYPGSLQDHILSSMGKNADVFPMYMEEYPAVELFELLSKYPPPSGKISSYPIRYVHSIWQEDPKSYLGMNEREVKFFRIY
jgi:hypothetical protein